MSVISRMLRDLEARKAQPAADRTPRTLKPGREPGPGRKRRHGDGRRLLALALALVLIGVAAGLWWQRAPELRAGLALAVDRVGDHWDAWRSGAADGSETAKANSEAQPDPSPEPEQSAARLAAARFNGNGGQAELELRLEGDLGGEPGYTRQGATVSVRVPADASRLQMPAPPAEQDVFESVTLQTNGERRSTIRLQVAEEARFDLARSGESLRLTGRLPAASEAAESKPAAAEPQPSTADAQRITTRSDDEPPQENAAAADEAATEAAPAESPDEAAAEKTPESGSAPTTTAANSASEPTSSGGAAADDADPPASERGSGGGMHKDDRSTPAVRAERRYREARKALSTGDVGQARRLLRNALELDPDLHGARDLLVALHRRAGQAEAARDALAQGVERAPRRVGYAKPYARLLVDAGDLERAARVLADAAGAAGDDAEFHALTAAVAQRQGRHEAAASAYTRALELEAGNGRWWLGLGVSLAASGHPGEAAAAFREARRTGSLGSRLDAWVRDRIRALEADSG